LKPWVSLISKPNFFKLIASREDYGHFAEEPNLHEAFQEKKNTQSISFTVTNKTPQVTQINVLYI